MKYFRLIWYDIRSGFWENRKKILAFILVVAFFCLEFYGKKRVIYIKEDAIPQGTVLDCLFYLHAGMNEYIPDVRYAFRLPVRWLLLHFLVLYSTLYYPFRDLQVLGGNMLQRGAKRSRWWLSKCVWVVLYTIVSYVILCSAAIGISWMMGDSIVWDITKEFTLRISGGVNYPQNMGRDFYWILLLMPLLVMITMNLFQLSLSLFVKPLYSFFISAILLLASAYKLSPLLIGNYAMMLRQKCMLSWGMEAKQGIWLAGGMIMFAVIVGMLRFRKWDILHQAKD